MKKNFPLLIAIVLTSCATSYVPIEPESINYGSADSTKDVIFEYKYDVLEKKYGRKEKKKKIKLLSVKITNNTSKDFTLGKDYMLINDNKQEILLLDSNQLYKPIKQNVATYFLYLLLTPIKLFETKERNGFEEQEVIFPIGYVLGPGITALNVIKASNGNSKLKKELEQYNLFNKTIKAGQTIHGILGFSAKNYSSLRIQKK